MPSLNRRHFLQFASSTLATLGLSQLDILQHGDRYAKVLAQSTPRKLALLVGINAYPESSNFAALQGCVTDVELQRQLLITRFGFNPKDIVVLTDAQATRKGILTTFEEHLIKQAKPGDVVVYHYSGHGSQIADPDKDTPDGLNSTFVPVDSALPTDFPGKGGTVKDIMGHTLFLLMSAVQTENLTVVLDSCHSGGGLRNAGGQRGDRIGNLQLRSHRFARGTETVLQAIPLEFEYQQQWLSRLNMSPQEYISRRRKGVAKGVVIASTKPDQLAADAPFSDFYAGAFTYLMTQYLWQQPGKVIVEAAVSKIANDTTKVSSSQQEPIFEAKPGSNNEEKPLYFVEELATPAEAVITDVQSGTAKVWLGGLDPQTLVAFEKGAVLNAVDPRGNTLGQVKIETRSGLVGQGKIVSDLKPGVLLQEQIRGIPANLTLKIGLDPSLGTDAAQAKQALQTLKRIEAIPLQQGEVHYILGRITQEYLQQLKKQKVQPLPALGSLGLFSPGLDVIPGSFDVAGETVTVAITRLQAKFKSLLAARVVKTTLNTNSSRLNVSVSLIPEGKANELVASAFTIRGANKKSAPPPILTSPIKTLPLGSFIQILIKNNEPRDLYFSVLVIDSAGEMAVIFPNQWTASSDVMKVGAGATLKIPDTNKDSFQLQTQEPKGTTEVLVIASSAPLGGALKALQGLASRGGQSRGPVALSEPTDVIGSLLNDVDAATRSSRGSSASTSATRSVDTTQLAAMSITFDVV